MPWDLTVQVFGVLGGLLEACCSLNEVQFPNQWIIIV